MNFLDLIFFLAVAGVLNLNDSILTRKLLVPKKTVNRAESMRPKVETDFKADEDHSCTLEFVGRKAKINSFLHHHSIFIFCKVIKFNYSGVFN